MSAYLLQIITGNKKKFEQQPYGEHDPYYDYDGYGQTYNGVYADAGYNQGYADYGYGYPVGSEGIVFYVVILKLVNISIPF